MKDLIGLFLQIIAIHFFIEARGGFPESEYATLVYASIGTALYVFGHFILHDYKSERRLKQT